MVDPEPRVRLLMSCLGDESRFALVRRLLKGERCVSDLAHDVGLSQSCTTRHLQVLQREHLVVSARDGKRVMFRLCLDEPQVSALLAWALSARGGHRAASPGRGKARRRAAARSAVEDLAPAAGNDTPGAGGPIPELGGGQASTPPPGPSARRPTRSDLEDFLL